MNHRYIASLLLLTRLSCWAATEPSDELQVSQQEIDQALTDLSAALQDARALAPNETNHSNFYPLGKKTGNAVYDNLTLKNSEVTTVPDQTE